MSEENWRDRVLRSLLFLRNRHFFVFDVACFLVLPFVALALRTEDALSAEYTSSLLVYTLARIPLWVAVFVAMRLYAVYWQYASVEDFWQIFAAVALAGLLNLFLFFWVLRPFGWVYESFPRSIPYITILLTLIMVGGSRAGVRLLDYRLRYRQKSDAAAKRVAIFGAGEAGLMMVRELQSNPQMHMTPVAFLDDDAQKHGLIIQGVPVLGGREWIGRLAREMRIERMIIAMPRAAGKTVREITALCQKAKLPVQIVPGMYELLNGTVTVNQLRNVQIEDLLRREPFKPSNTGVVELLRDKCVLVTGAGGSIGGELCRQIALCEPSQLILLGHGENSIFMQQQEMHTAFPKLPCVSVIADVRDSARVNGVMAEYHPACVFHAAAHKHVSLMEHNLRDAVSNNVLGTRTLADAAIANGVETFVMISTDKAVNPESVMGVTKRVAELYVHARAREFGRRYVVVRFGNVLGSRGSVVPIFRQQIANGGPVLVTDPEARRFFMTIPEAVDLVLQAAALGRGGEIFALDMGEPVKIVDLARDLIRLSGLEEGRDIDIEYTGLRPGEKLYEELFVPGEMYERTAREKIFVTRNGAHASPEQNAQLYAAIEQLIEAAQTQDEPSVRAQLARIVPEYKSAF